MRDRTGGLAAHGTGRRTAHRPKPVALADRARSRLRYMPDRGWPGPGTAAPAASHEAGHRPLVPVVLKDRPRTHPQPARPAHRSLLPIRAPPAGLIDPLAAAAPAGAASWLHPRDQATRAPGPTQTGQSGYWISRCGQPRAGPTKKPRSCPQSQCSAGIHNRLICTPDIRRILTIRSAHNGGSARYRLRLLLSRNRDRVGPGCLGSLGPGPLPLPPRTTVRSDGSRFGTGNGMARIEGEIVI